MKCEEKCAVENNIIYDQPPAQRRNRTYSNVSRDCGGFAGLQVPEGQNLGLSRGANGTFSNEARLLQVLQPKRQLRLSCFCCSIVPFFLFRWKVYTNDVHSISQIRINGELGLLPSSVRNAQSTIPVLGIDSTNILRPN